MTQMQEETEGHAQLNYLSQVSKEKTLKKCDRQFVFQAQWGEKRKKIGWKVGKGKNKTNFSIFCLGLR